MLFGLLHARATNFPVPLGVVPHAILTSGQCVRGVDESGQECDLAPVVKIAGFSYTAEQRPQLGDSRIQVRARALCIRFNRV